VVRVLCACLWLAFAAALAAPADAQMFGHHNKPPRGGSAPQQVDCDLVAANPSSGMDKASCEAMNKAAADYNSAQNDPAGARPGDDAETCDQIKAELMQQPFTAPNAQHVAAAQAATTDFRAKTAVIQGEAAAAAAAETATATAAGAVSQVNPIAGRAAAAAVQAQQAATQQALSAQAKATLTPAMRNVTSSTVSVMGDMTPQLTQNPRMAHLMAMSNARRCHGF
jgi:hypothetical protein